MGRQGGWVFRVLTEALCVCDGVFMMSCVGVGCVVGCFCIAGMCGMGVGRAVGCVCAVSRGGLLLL